MIKLNSYPQWIISLITLQVKAIKIVVLIILNYNYNINNYLITKMNKS